MQILFLGNWKESKPSITDMYGEDTDDEELKDNLKNSEKSSENGIKKEGIDPYDVDTDVDDDDDNLHNLPKLPAYFSGLNFFIYGSMAIEVRKSIVRGIIAANGKVRYGTDFLCFGGIGFLKTLI